MLASGAVRPANKEKAVIGMTISITFEEFVEEVKRVAHEELGYQLELMQFYPEGYTSDDPGMMEWIQDSNMKFVGEKGMKLLTDFLTLGVPGGRSHVGIHRIAVRKMYEKALKNGFEAAFNDIRNVQKSIDSAKIDLERIERRASADYEQIRGQLIIRPLNYRLHIHDLNDCVYKKVSDFTLVLYQLLGDSNNSLVTSKIKRSELKHWGMEGQEEQVIADALENTARLYPACVYDKRTQREENFMEKEFSRENITFELFSKQILLSSVRTTNGAAAFFYPGVQEKMAKIMGGPFQAIFMNVNDVMIFDKKDPLAYAYLTTVNSHDNKWEMLSEKLYLCDGKNMTPGLIVKTGKDGKTTEE